MAKTLPVKMVPLETVLVANRGEIACRITRTLRSMGIRSVAVYSDADRGAKHVGMADVAVHIGPAAATESYLSIPAVVEAAVRSGAQAIHPGYGFLSENVEFARACAEAGIVFIGPGVDAIEAMGDKIRAKAHVTARGVAVIPGAGTAGMTDTQLIKASSDVGFPLLIKPSAGGGGKGMTVVERAADLSEALKASRRVALKAFGDDTLLLERLVRKPRHIEVQVLADSFGHVIHLGERECSLQRRNQKVIEEAPSPLLDESTRAAIGDAACEVARSVDYAGAGTVEFLVSDESPGEFFFMEMNTRLQVEHPVTELVTGLDLVEWQVRIAAGEPLTLQQHDVVLNGHAVEARLYAEDPAAGFLPAAGTVLALVEPDGVGVRVDSGIVVGSVVASDYDPMLAKVIAWGSDRAEALTRLDAALGETVVLGVRTNQAFLRALLADDDVIAGRLDTGLIERMLSTLDFAEPAAAALATAALLEHSAAWSGADLWAQPSGWRIGAHRAARYHAGTEVEVSGPPEAAEVTIAGHLYATKFSRTADSATVEVDGISSTFRWARSQTHTWLALGGETFALRRSTRAELLVEHRATLTRVEGTASPNVRSAMPGTVVALNAATGDVVEVGQPLLTIEAMKMEHTMLASVAGVVTISVAAGDQVKLDQIVARISPHGLIPTGSIPTGSIPTKEHHD